MIQSALICSPRDIASTESDARPSSVTAAHSNFFHRLMARSTSIKPVLAELVASLFQLLELLREIHLSLPIQFDHVPRRAIDERFVRQLGLYRSQFCLHFRDFLVEAFPLSRKIDIHDQQYFAESSCCDWSSCVRGKFPIH